MFVRPEVIAVGRRRFHRIEKHELLYPNVVFPLLSRKGREALRCDVYDLIAARQPERGVSARDRAELHSGKVDQIIIIPPLATAVVKSFLPDQQPFAVFGPVKRVAASTSDPSGEKGPESGQCRFSGGGVAQATT